MRNPFLPKRRSNQGPLFELAPLKARRIATGNASSPCTIDVRSLDGTRARTQAMLARHNGEAGLMPVNLNNFLSNSIRMGASLDVLGLAHGAVGCGAFGLTERLHLPGFTQGIDGFSALDLCTNIQSDDLKDNGNARLSRAIDETQQLFPLVRGIAILNEEPIGLVGSDIQGILKAKSKGSKRFLAASSYGLKTSGYAAQNAALKVAASHRSSLKGSPYDVVVAHIRSAPGLIWIVSKLLREIGLNPVHTFDHSSCIDDLAKTPTCKAIIAVSHFTKKDGVGLWDDSHAFSLQRLFGMPHIWACFSGPSATDASLRTIASNFDWKIQRNAETVIVENRRKVEAVIARYRPRLEGKLCLNLHGLGEEDLEIYRLLGVRVGTRESWPGKTGAVRKPNVALKWNNEKSLRSYLREANPDIAFHYGVSDHVWHKRGIAALPFSPLFDKNFGAFWGYDGLEYLAAALDRHINAPWRKLVKPPWPNNSG